MMPARHGLESLSLTNAWLSYWLRRKDERPLSGAVLIAAKRQYSNLSKKMAMKIGKAYELSEVEPRQFEKLADEIGFTKPLVKRRVIDHAKKMLQQIEKVAITHPITDEIRKFIGEHCSNVLDQFTTDKSKKQAERQ